MIKSTEERLITLNNHIAVVKEHIDKLGELQSNDKEVFWKALKKIIASSKEAHLKLILQLLGQEFTDSVDITFSKLRFRAGCIQAYEEILTLVDKNQDACDEATGKLTELKAIAKEIKDNIEMQNGGNNGEKD